MDLGSSDDGAVPERNSLSRNVKGNLRFGNQSDRAARKECLTRVLPQNSFDIETFTTRGPDGESLPEKADAQCRLSATFSTSALIVSGFFSPNEYLAPRSSLVQAGTRKLLTASKAADPYCIRLQLRFKRLRCGISQLILTRSDAPGYGSGTLALGKWVLSGVLSRMDKAGREKSMQTMSQVSGKADLNALVHLAPILTEGWRISAGILHPVRLADTIHGQRSDPFVKVTFGAQLNLITKERRKWLPSVLCPDRRNPTGFERLNEVAVNHDMRGQLEQAGNRRRKRPLVIRSRWDTVVAHTVLYVLSNLTKTARQEESVPPETYCVTQVPTFGAFVIYYEIGRESGKNEVGGGGPKG